MANEANMVKENDQDVLPWFVENTSKLIIHNINDNKISEYNLLQDYN